MAKNDNLEFSWNFPEFEKHERNKKWWVWFIIIDVIVFLFAILSANFLFALIIIIVTGILIFRHYNEPETIDCHITAKGIEVENKLYPWSVFTSFWLAYDPPAVKSLYLAFKSGLKSHLTIPLQKQDPLQIRQFLNDYLKEDLDREDELTIDALGRLLKL